MFHEDSDHDVDEDELRHQDEHDEEEGRDVLVDAAVAEAVVGLIALLAQRVLHDPVPVVPCAPSPCRGRHYMFCYTLPVAILNKVRKAIPKDLKCACSPRPWQGYSSSHSVNILSSINVDKYLESRSNKNTMNVL